MIITISNVPATGVDTAFVFQEQNVGPGFRGHYPLTVVNNYQEDLRLSLRQIEVVANDGLLDVTTLSFAKNGIDFLVLPPGFEVNSPLNIELACVGAGMTEDQLMTAIAIDRSAPNFYQGRSFTLKYHLDIVSTAACPEQVPPATPVPTAVPTTTPGSAAGESGSLAVSVSPSPDLVSREKTSLVNDDLSVTIERMDEVVYGASGIASTGLGAPGSLINCSGGCSPWVCYLILFFCLLNFGLLLGLYRRRKKKPWRQRE